MDYPQLSRARADALFTRLNITGDAFPDWYLRRWHFHPDGYLSAAGVRWYDRVIRPLYNWPAERGVDRYVAQIVSRTRSTTVLDAGCGPGRLVSSLARQHPRLRVVGIDLSPLMVGRAGRRLAGTANASIQQADLTNQDLAAVVREPVDCVVVSHVLGHVPVEVAEAMTARLARTLRPGGHLVVVDHAWHPPPSALGELVRRGSRSFRGGMIRVAVYRRALDGLPS